jgi:hypothetical protein
MKKLRICLCLLACGLWLTASTAKARPLLPFCEDACCNGNGTPTTQCITHAGVVTHCGPPYAYLCPFA